VNLLFVLCVVCTFSWCKYSLAMLLMHFLLLQVVDVTYGLFVWPCAPLLAKFVFHNRHILAHKHILEVSAHKWSKRSAKIDTFRLLMWTYNCHNSYTCFLLHMWRLWGMWHCCIWTTIGNDNLDIWSFIFINFFLFFFEISMVKIFHFRSNVCNGIFLAGAIISLAWTEL